MQTYVYFRFIAVIIFPTERDCVLCKEQTGPNKKYK